MDNELLVKSIKETCLKRNLTVNQLEKKLGYSPSLISRWIKSSPSLDKIVDIADYFHISIDELIGRNINNTKNEPLIDDFVVSLTKLTNDKVIKWEQVLDFDKPIVNDESSYDLFELYGEDEDIEIYKAKYNDSWLYLVVQYEIDLGKIDNLDINIYLQPDINSRPVIQEFNEKLAEDFWISIRKKFIGIPDAWKAAKIKDHLIKNAKENILCDFSIEYKSNTKQDNDIFTDLKTPEVREVFAMLSNPKMVDALKSAEEIIKYINHTHLTEKEIKNSIKTLSSQVGDVFYDVREDEIKDYDPTYGITDKSTKFYMSHKESFGIPYRVIGKYGDTVYFISNTMIIKLTGFTFGKYHGGTGYNGLKNLLKETGFDISDESIFDKEEFDITK